MDSKGTQDTGTSYHSLIPYVHILTYDEQILLGKTASCSVLVCATQTEKRHPNPSEYQLIPMS